MPKLFVFFPHTGCGMKQHPTFNLTYDDSMTAKWHHHHHHHHNFVPSNRHRWNYSIGTGVENTIITVAPPTLVPLSQLTGTAIATTGYLDTNGDNRCVAVANQLCMCNLCNANTYVTPSSSLSSQASAMSSTSTSSHTSTMHKQMIQLNHNSYGMTAAAAAAANVNATVAAAATSTGHFSYSAPNPNFMFPAATASTADFVVDNSSESSNGATSYHTADHAKVFSKQGWWSSHSFHSRHSLLLPLLLLLILLLIFLILLFLPFFR